MRVLRIVLAISIWLLIGSQCSANAHDYAAYVLTLTPAGSWAARTPDGKIISLSEKEHTDIPNRSVLMHAPDGGKLDLVFYDGKAMSCPDDPDCDAPLIRGKGTSVMTQIAAAVKAFFGQVTNSNSMVIPLPQKSDTTSLQDVVIPMKEGYLDLSAPFKNVLLGAGALQIGLEQVAYSKSDTAPHNPAKIWQCDSSKLAHVPVEGIKPGLYELRVYTTDVKAPEVVDDCWVLILQATNFPAAKELFDRALAGTKDWSFEPTSTRGFMRAYLGALSQQFGIDNHK